MERVCGNCKYCRENIYETYVCLLARKFVVTKNTPACFDFRIKENTRKDENSD